MACRGFSKLFLLFLLSAFCIGSYTPALAPPPNLSSTESSPSHGFHKDNIRGFKIADDMFWKDGQPFQIIGGDLHYFRVLPEYWEDRLLRAKALGLNTIQTYVPWNLHEPSPQKWVFEGIANIESFLKLTQELGFLVMLRAGPYICAEWDLGGFPAWLLAIKPALKLRSSDPVYLNLVERWWGVLFPKIGPFLYDNGGPIIMVQVENEFGSFGNDKEYLRYLATLARRHLGNDIILYTTDGGTKNTLEKGTIPEEGVYAAVDFSTGENPWPIFKLQKRYNAPGKSPPLSAEFYTGWLTHWGEPNAKTNASYTAAYLEKILSCNGSVVLYISRWLMAEPTLGFLMVQILVKMIPTTRLILLLMIMMLQLRNLVTWIIQNFKVHDRAQVFVSCTSEGARGYPTYVGAIERWSNKELEIPNIKCPSDISLFILVENMGRINYGPYIYDRKGILSSVTIDGHILHGWKLYPISMDRLSLSNETLVRQLSEFHTDKISIQTSLELYSGSFSQQPGFYESRYFIGPKDLIKDTFISFRGWNKGVAFVNSFNIGRFWPHLGPQCTLYVPAPLLHHGENVVVILELHSPKVDLTIEFVEQPDFTCGQIQQ